MIRSPAVAGQFYPADPEALRRHLVELTQGRSPSTLRVIAVVVPHAGYVYSGRVAAVTYTSVRLPRRMVILCPNHTGAGEPVAVDGEGEWQTPLGRVPIDASLAGAILERCRQARLDGVAHSREHSLEVQLPFLQHLVGEFRFVPICVGTLRLPVLLDLGRSIAEAIAAAGEEVLLIVSSDMSHYVPAALADRQDHKAIDRIVAVDPEGLHRVVLREDISMCGVAPAVVGLEAARRLGAREGRLIAYGHSGETTGDIHSVVAYAGLAIA